MTDVELLEFRGLKKAVLARLWDEGARLIFADWLEEHGGAVMAADLRSAGYWQKVFHAGAWWLVWRPVGRAAVFFRKTSAPRSCFNGPHEKQYYNSHKRCWCCWRYWLAETCCQYASKDTELARSTCPAVR